jgi:tetratricopeptide (TPR) repeat protein
LWEKAVAYLHQAGLRATASGANRGAVYYLEQALGTLRHLPETRRRSELAIDIRLEIRNALLPLNDWVRIGDHLKEAEVLARSLGDQRRLGRIATWLMAERRLAGDHDAGLKFEQEALTIAHTLGDRSIEVVAMYYVGDWRYQEGDYNEAVQLLERNLGLDGKLRAERFGTSVILWAASKYLIATALSHLGRFDEAMGHAEAAVRIAEETDHLWTLFGALANLGYVHLNRGDFRRASRFIERSLDLGRTWQFVDRTPDVAAALGYTFALAGRTKESLALVAGAVQAFRARQRHVASAGFLNRVGRTYLAVGQLVEATTYAREALALTRQLGMRGIEAQALSLTADITAASGAENAEGYYRESLALAEPRGMRPLVAHCHLGLGKLHRRKGDRERALEHLTTAMALYREMGMNYGLEQAEAELCQLC